MTRIETRITQIVLSRCCGNGGAVGMGSGQQMRWPLRWVAVWYCCGDAAADAANSKEGAVW